MNENRTERIALKIASPHWKRDGYEIDFKGADLSEPPHVHIEKDDHKAKFWLKDFEFAYKGGFGEGDERKIKKIIRSLYDELMAAWKAFVSRRKSFDR